MRKIIIAIVIIIVLGGGLYYFLGDDLGSATSDRENIYFKDKIIELGEADIGKPNEGFDYTALTLAFPGVLPDDFKGVKTTAGQYEFEGTTLKFVRDPNAPASIIERALSDDGYKKLLENLANRFQIDASNNAKIDEVISKINLDNN